MFYSKSTNGFYSTDIHGDNIPADAVEINKDEHAALFEGQSAGKKIVVDANGYPILQDLPPSLPVPQKIIRFQALAALYQAGLLDSIKTYMADPATDGFTKLAWEEAQEFNRASPMVASIGALFGLTDPQMDDLFRFAATITA